MMRFAVVLPLLAPALAHAQAAAQAAPARSPAAGLLQVMLYLLLVLGLFAGIAWAMKRFGPKSLARTQNIKLVGGLSVGGRERILVVEVAGRWIVVGATPTQLTALAAMDRPADAEIAGAPGAAQPGAPAGRQFADWLKQTIDKRNNGNNA